MYSSIKKIYKKIKNHLILLNRKRLKMKHKNKEDAVRWGIIGLGHMANCFADYLECSDDSRIVAVASRDIDKAEAFRKNHGAERAYGSYSELLQQEDIDIVYIATPHQQHYENMLSCIRYKKNFLCEKPFVSSINEMTAVYNALNGTGIFAMEGMWMYYLPTVQLATEWIENKKIGDIKLIKIDFSRKLSHLSSSGVLYDYGVYAIAFATKYMGRKVKVDESFVKKDKDIDAEWLIKLSDGDLSAEITLSALRDGSQTAEIFGSNGCIRFDAPFNRTNSIRLLDTNNKTILRRKFSYKLDGFEFEIQAAQHAVSGIQGISESSTLLLTRTVTRLLEDTMASAREEQIDE